MNNLTAGVNTDHRRRLPARVGASRMEDASYPRSSACRNKAVALSLRATGAIPGACETATGNGAHCCGLAAYLHYANDEEQGVVAPRLTLLEGASRGGVALRMGSCSLVRVGVTWRGIIRSRSGAGREGARR